jgi:hypothetical protein
MRSRGFFSFGSFGFAGGLGFGLRGDQRAARLA